MLTAILLLVTGCLLVLGSLLCSYAKSGPQETLGGAMIMVGILAGMVGTLCWWAGL